MAQKISDSEFLSIKMWQDYQPVFPPNAFTLLDESTVRKYKKQLKLKKKAGLKVHAKPYFDWNPVWGKRKYAGGQFVL